MLSAAQTGSVGGAIDLPAEMQRELRDLESRGDRLTHYELLGIPADADGGTIRRAYFEKSKRFHPDAWYRKDVGEYGPLLSKWFQKLAMAYQALSDEEARAEYDREHHALFSTTDRLAIDKRQLSRAEEERREHERRERLLRTKGFARLGAARKLFEDALKLAERGERAQAIATLKGARELDPNRKEISHKLVELEKEQAKIRAKLALNAAKEHEDHDRLPQALGGYTAAFQNDGTLIEAAIGAARCFAAQSQWQQASTWASRALELDQKDTVARMLLARGFVGLNMKARARTELQAILAQTPDHKEAKALLRSI